MTEHTATAELPPGDYIRLSVQDTGHGISPERQKDIFKPFFSLQQAKEADGLGLLLVQGIVAGHNGLITVDSQMGRGTTVSVFFPETVS